MASFSTLFRVWLYRIIALRISEEAQRIRDLTADVLPLVAPEQRELFIANMFLAALQAAGITAIETQRVRGIGRCRCRRYLL
ncbi:MAG: hypothetical protein WAK33_04310 [Silvibacterium sp.]